MQRTQFCAKSAKNDLKTMDFLQHNLHFETEGVLNNVMMEPALHNLHQMIKHLMAQILTTYHPS